MTGLIVTLAGMCINGLVKTRTWIVPALIGCMPKEGYLDHDIGEDMTVSASRMIGFRISIRRHLKRVRKCVRHTYGGSSCRLDCILLIEPH